MPDIPSSWDDTFVKICFDVQLGKMLQSKPNSYEDIEVPYLKAQHVNWDGVTVKSLPLMFSSETEVQKFAAKNGDLLVCEGGEVGRAAILEGLEDVAIIQNALHRVRRTQLGDVGYLNYLLRNIADAGWFAILCNKATIAHLTGEKLGAIRIPVPSIEEQTQITKFLDYKTAQIDYLIEKKKALIEKLNEQRIAMITQAVTKGLNPNAPMKDSEVDWLGEVPAHWEVLSIKRLTPVKRGASPRPIQDQKYFDDDGEYSWVRIADVTANDHYLVNTYQTLSELGKSLSVPLEPGTLFLSIAGSVGKPMITNIKCCIHDGFVYFPYYEHNPEFFYYIFYSGQPYLGLGKLGTQLNLNTDTVGDIKIGLPSIEEQHEIVGHLHAEMGKLDNMESAIKAAIERLNEYRTALITAAVTGKIDVRNIPIPKQGAA
jgi:type I restriction enzyme S subunit